MEFSQAYVRDIMSQFSVDGEFVQATYWDIGHINDTYIVTLNSQSDLRRVLLQRINHAVFTNPPVLMRNFRRVTEHLASKLKQRGDDHTRGTPAIYDTVDGDSLFRSDEGNYWRSMVFIGDTSYVEVAENDHQVREAGRAFADFQKMLTDLPGERLHDTIPLFHHTPTRFQQLEDAIALDPINRSLTCREEIGFALDRKWMTSQVTDAMAMGEIPERITHNDTKINNVLFDTESGKAICVVDLDTVMPGSVLYDFGDLVRTSAGDFAENERDLSRVRLLPERFEALVQGYVEVADFLVPRERELLAFAGRLITFEIGIRFLTDYLLGDHYFRVHSPDENLIRARAQLSFVQAMEDNAAAMESSVHRYAS